MFSITGRSQIRVVVWDDETDQEQRDDVENEDSPKDLLCGLWQGLSRVRCLGGGETDELCAGEGESCVDKDGTQTVETVVERTWLVPGVCSKVDTGRRATDIDDDGENDESNDGNNLDRGEDEFRLAVTADTAQVDGDDDYDEDGDEDTDIDTRVPIINDDGRRRELEGEDDEPLHGVVPTHGETPGRIDETGREDGERTLDGEHDGHLSQCVDDGEQHGPDEQETDEDRGRTSGRERVGRTNKETGTDGTTDGNHLEMSSLEGPVQITAGLLHRGSARQVEYVISVRVWGRTYGLLGLILDIAGISRSVCPHGRLEGVDTSLPEAALLQGTVGRLARVQLAGRGRDVSTRVAVMFVAHLVVAHGSGQWLLLHLVGGHTSRLEKGGREKVSMEKKDLGLSVEYKRTRKGWGGGGVRETVFCARGAGGRTAGRPKVARLAGELRAQSTLSRPSR